MPFTRPSSTETSPVTAMIPGAAGDQPKWMVVREIDFGVIDGKLKFYFSRAWGPHPVTDRAGFETDVKLLAAGRFPPGLRQNRMRMKDDYKCLLTYSAPDQFRYVVFILAASKSWQFAQDGVPIAVAKATENKGIYYDANRVTPNGYIQPEGTAPVPGPWPLDRCRVAFLAMRGGATADAIYPHPHDFNLYIDLYDETDSTVTPIVIDPDIRYPGGNTLDDPPE